MKPLLKWAGGKSRLLPIIVELINRYQWRRLVEPFAGGLSISLGIEPDKALLNDINPYLINLYKQIQSGLTRSLDMHPQHYYQYRDRFNSLISESIVNDESAELFYYLNKTGFNGLCRFNKKGGYNVPKGSYKTVNYVKSFDEYRKVFTNWNFQCGDFSNLDIKEGDVIYIDPPYDDGFTQYSKEGFGWHDQLRLVAWLQELAVPVIASNKSTDRIKALYLDYGYSIKEIPVGRSISCDGNRKPVMELLMSNYII